MYAPAKLPASSICLAGKGLPRPVCFFLRGLGLGTSERSLEVAVWAGAAGARDFLLLLNDVMNSKACGLSPSMFCR